MEDFKIKLTEKGEWLAKHTILSRLMIKEDASFRWWSKYLFIICSIDYKQAICTSIR